MRSILAFGIAIVLAAGALAGTKDSGTATLKDMKPAGMTDKKQKKQRYDLVFDSPAGKEYTCRTGEKTTVKATDFVVGNSLIFKVKDDKAELKNAGGDKLKCTIVRVENTANTADTANTPK